MQRISEGIHRNFFALLRQEYLGKEEPLIQITFIGDKDNNIIVIDEAAAAKLQQRLTELLAKA